MTPIDNTEDRYGAVAILFHWSMALLVIGLAALGLYMVTLPDVGFNTNKVTLVHYHKEFGLFMLPDFVHRDHDLFQRYVAIHQWLGYASFSSLR
jgi:cytochrome b561